MTNTHNKSGKTSNDSNNNKKGIVDKSTITNNKSNTSVNKLNDNKSNTSSKSDNGKSNTSNKSDNSKSSTSSKSNNSKSSTSTLDNNKKSNNSKKLHKTNDVNNKSSDNDLDVTQNKIIPDDIMKNMKLVNNLNDLKQKIDADILTLKKFKNDIKKMENSYHHDIAKLWKSKKKRNTNGDKTGFIKNKKLPKQLAELIEVPPNTEMSMPVYTKKFYEHVLHGRGLLYNNDKRVFRADAELQELFDLPDSVNLSVDHKDANGFNFSTLQKCFSKVMNKYRTLEEQPEIEIDSDSETDYDSAVDSDTEEEDNDKKVKMIQKKNIARK